LEWVNEPASSIPLSESPDTASADAAPVDAPTPAGSGETLDLDAVERDLTDVQTALERLDDGSYWTDEVTGAAIPDEVLSAFPLTRTVAG